MKQLSKPSGFLPKNDIHSHQIGGSQFVANSSSLFGVSNSEGAMPTLQHVVGNLKNLEVDVFFSLECVGVCVV